MKKFGSELPDAAKTREITDKANAADQKLRSDPGFLARIEADPQAALSELHFTADNIRTFRVLEGVTTRDSCSCVCLSTSCGTGVGCNGGSAPGATTGC